MLRLCDRLRIIDKPAVADRCAPKALGRGMLRLAIEGALARVEASERGATGAADSGGAALGIELTATAAGAAGAAGRDGGGETWKPGVDATEAAGAADAAVAAEAVPVMRDLASADTTCTSPEVTSTTPSNELLLVT